MGGEIMGSGQFPHFPIPTNSLPIHFQFTVNSLYRNRKTKSCTRPQRGRCLIRPVSATVARASDINAAGAAAATKTERAMVSAGAC